jgi:hypothetical protein
LDGHTGEAGAASSRRRKRRLSSSFSLRLLATGVRSEQGF